jgi:hypothetical protein
MNAVRRLPGSDCNDLTQHRLSDWFLQLVAHVRGYLLFKCGAALGAKHTHGSTQIYVRNCKSVTDKRVAKNGLLASDITRMYAPSPHVFRIYERESHQEPA